MDRLKRNSIISLVQSLISELPYDCIEVVWEQVDRALIIYIDGPNGIVMDDCLAVNKILGEAPEIDDLVSTSFRLEVSSPGVERPLRTAEHFINVVGQTVSVSLTEQVSGRKRGKGVLQSVSDSGDLCINIDSNEWHCPIELLNRANLVYDWS